MLTKNFNGVADVFLSWLGYQVFITPLRFRPPSDYHTFMQRAQEWFFKTRNDRIVLQNPRPHVLHRFAPLGNANGKRVLITHGWMSCALWMSKHIFEFRQRGFEVFAIDFPAHGESQGLQLTWVEAVQSVLEVLNTFGPFNIALGHSFGGSMLINTVNLSGQFPEYKIQRMPEFVITMGSPTRMHTQIQRIAKRLQLSASAYKSLGRTIVSRAPVNPFRLQLRYLAKQSPPLMWICLHGDNDQIVLPDESETFCEIIPNSNLVILPNMDHFSPLVDDRFITEIFSRIN